MGYPFRLHTITVIHRNSEQPTLTIRRLGELIVAQKESVGLNAGGQITPPLFQRGTGVIDARPTLTEAGIDRKLSGRAQKMAALADDDFEQIWKMHQNLILTRHGQTVLLGLNQ
jgi:hypothetical protein